MAKYLVSFILLLFISKINAQSYNNEWIDYSKTYYKFKISKDGLYRINQNTLQNAGLGSIASQNFQLWRNGVQVPIFTTLSFGIFTSSDYIEFWGKSNDGLVDTSLYNITSYQISTKWNLINDTASYFLTSNSTISQNLRLTNTTNAVSTNILPIEQNFIFKTGVYPKNKIHAGFAADIGEYLYSSTYDLGEGWSTSDFYPGSPYTTPALTNLFPDLTSNIPARLITKAAGFANNARKMQVFVNNTKVMEPSIDFFNSNYFDSTFNLNLLASGQAIISTNDNCTNSNDRLVVGYQEIKYPRLFNFGNESNFEFDLAANSNGNYLEITNFNSASSIPILYDLTNGKRYVAVVSGALLKFALLPSSVSRKMVLVNQASSNITNVQSLQVLNFTNFITLPQQGDFLILTSKYLHSSTSASNSIEKYKAYRNSSAGGSFNTKIIDVEDLYDQYSYGINKHPMALRNYLRQTRNYFTIAPKNILIIGRGINYIDARMNDGQPFLDILNMVPTFGSPASDNLLTANPGTSIQTTPIGRIAAINNSEVDAYLNKIKEYEYNIADMNFTIANKAWMKNGAFVTGSNDQIGTIINGFNNEYMNFWKDTSVGAQPYLFTKINPGGVDQLNNAFMDHLWNEGHSVLEYFGHSSATTLEYNLDDPSVYNNQGKYPLMIINGCNAGDYFVYDPSRISSYNNQTLSEKFVLIPNKGSIGFIASTSFGILNYLHYYCQSFFKNNSSIDYGSTVGLLMRGASQRLLNIAGTNDFYARMQTEQNSLHGDPSIKLNVSYPKPDYVIEDQTVKINPSFISIAENNFKVDVKYMNLGKAINDSINISIKREYPSGLIETVIDKRIKAAYYADSMQFIFNIVPARDKGLNKLTIKIESNDAIAEMSETNNTITKSFFIFEDEAKPIQPYNYAIVNTLPVTLIASTANPLSVSKTYNLELDTTELFNSPLKTTRSLTQIGGLLEFAPFSTLIPNTVYYWRVSVAGSNPIKWNNFSFTYLPTSTLGFNQGHFFQHLKSTYNGIHLDSSSRKFVFDSTTTSVIVRNGVYPTAGYDQSHFVISINQNAYIRGICELNSFTVNVFDPITLKPWRNMGGQYGSSTNNCVPNGSDWNFTYPIQLLTNRNAVRDLLNLVPNGYFIVVRNFNYYSDPVNNVANWNNDGPNSMYNTLKNNGFTYVDSINENRSFIFMYKKGNNSTFAPKQIFSEGNLDRISISSDVNLPNRVGYITSPAFGPAKDWKEVHWKGNSVDANITNDTAKVTIIGVKVNGVEDSLLTLNQTQLDYNIQNISASVYPYLKLSMKNIDTVNATPWQLDYWRLNYTPIPEGAIAPNILLNVKDSLTVGENLNVKCAFKNISYAVFDSIKVKIIILDQGGVSHTYILPKQKPLAIGETLNINYDIPTASLSGTNNLYIEFNPDNDQAEQYHFNNFLYKNFSVAPDKTNPLLDVTFDGTHILNKDIVSANPNILIKLKDENRYLLLDDTLGLKIQLKYPNASVATNYNWNTDTLKFFPATNTSIDNTASAEFKPKNLPDGEYELIVSGKDKNGNKASNLEYRVAFTVINKPMISNLLNYPNPFTTSTAFVFTITGSEVPQNIKVEIMTITGKIVREITKAELGPIRVGKNITEFKWDGTDQYGSRLANGVYLYRVVTNLNGKSLDKYKVGDDDKSDKYFNKGYGKMVLLK